MQPKIEAKPRRPAAIKSSGAAPKADRPFYLQVARALRAEILDGVHPVGANLPTEQELGARFAVSRFTIREALRQLREDGLVASRQGAGTVVVPSAPSDLHVLHAMSINDLLAFTTDTHIDIEFMKMVTIEDRLAVRTGLPLGEEWLAVRGFRNAGPEETPVCWTEYYINRDFAAVGRLLPRHRGPIFPLIETLFAVGIEAVQQEVSSALMPREQALRHGVPEGSAALEVRRLYRMAGGKIVQVTINLYPAARFRLSMMMRRVKG